MDTGKIFISGEKQEKEEASVLDKSIAEETEIFPLNAVDKEVTEEEPQPGPSSEAGVRKWGSTSSSSITAELVNLDAVGLRKRSAADVVTSDVTSSRSGERNDGNGDLEEPSPEIAPLNRIEPLVEPPKRSVERHSNCLMMSGMCIFAVEVVTQAVSGIIGLVGLLFQNQCSFFTENVWELSGLLAVSFFSFLFQCGLWCGNSMEEIRRNFLRCLILPNLPLRCVVLFISVRILVYFSLCLLLRSVWFIAMSCILIVLVNIPLICVIRGGR